MVADEILIKKAQGGDLAAYGEIVRRYQDRIYGMALRMLSSPEDARDASQETFVKVFRSLQSFDFRAGFATWLYKVATNVCFDILRRRGRERQRNLPLGEDYVREDSLRDNSPGPEEALLENESLEELRQSVNELPEGYRLALVLHHYQGLSYRQVAEVMELPEKTVATRIHRAKIMLKNMLIGGEGGAVRESKGNVKQLPGRRMSLL